MPATDQIDPAKLYSKITWRLIPYLFLLYILAYLDRSNVGFAAVEFQRDLHLTATIFGYGAGIYFLGQLMFDLPSNLLLQKVGPRLWIARIMITWGIVATCMIFVTGAKSFYAMRLALGVSEAGFFPGIILYLTYWFPSQERAKAVARFMTATSIAGVVGAELSRILLKLEGKFNLHGWQWLFLMEGVPTVLFGVSVLFLLRDHPDDAPWLTDAEKKWLDTELERDRNEGGAADKHNLGDAFRTPMVWVLAIIFLFNQVGIYSITYFMPTIFAGFLHASALNDAVKVSRYGALPYLAAAILTVIIGWSSDRTGERRFHIAACLLIGAAGFRVGRVRAQPHCVDHGLRARRHRLLQHDGPVLGAAHACARRAGRGRRRGHHYHDRLARRLCRPRAHRQTQGHHPQLHGGPADGRRHGHHCRNPLSLPHY